MCYANLEVQLPQLGTEIDSEMLAREGHALSRSKHGHKSGESVEKSI